MNNLQTKSQLYSQLKETIQLEGKSNFGIDKDAPELKLAIDYFFAEDDRHQEFRFDDLVRNGAYISNCSSLKILDMASGHGQFVLSALSRGLDCWGLEPGKDQHAFIKNKIRIFGLPAWYADRFVEGVGEEMPFPDNSFDYVTSFQTLEHVKDLQKVTDSLIRVVRNGGGVHIRCPNYNGTFEGHYLMPWIPIPQTKIVMRLVLKLLGRPTQGIDHNINYITEKKLIWSLIKSAKSFNVRILITDNIRLTYESGLRRRGIPVFPGASKFLKILIYVRDLFRKETNIDLFVRVLKSE